MFIPYFWVFLFCKSVSPCTCCVHSIATSRLCQTRQETIFGVRVFLFLLGLDYYRWCVICVIMLPFWCNALAWAFFIYLIVVNICFAAILNGNFFIFFTFSFELLPYNNFLFVIINAFVQLLFIIVFPLFPSRRLKLFEFVSRWHAFLVNCFNGKYLLLVTVNVTFKSGGVCFKSRKKWGLLLNMHQCNCVFDVWILYFDSPSTRVCFNWRCKMFSYYYVYFEL